MKSVTPVLCAVSLVANAALGYFVFRGPSAAAPAADSISASNNHRPTPASAVVTPPTEAGPAEVVVASPATASGGSIITGNWTTPRTDDELRTLIANMRAAGCPPSILRAVVDKIVSERYAANRADADLPFWKNPPRTPEKVAADQARERESRALREDLLGADSSPAARLDPIERRRQYGNLSDEKIDALIRLNRDYSDVRSVASAGRQDFSMESYQELMKQQAALEKEREADLATVLTPEEMADYEKRTSTTAGAVMRGLTTVDVSESEYAALYGSQKSFDAAFPRSIDFNNAELRAQRAQAQALLNEEARAVLGEERFYHYLEGNDSQFARTAALTKKFPAVTPAVAYQVYQLQVEAEAAVTKARTSGNLQQAAAVSGEYAARLAQLIPADAADAYKNQFGGSVFNVRAPRPVPTPVAPGTR